MAGWAFSLVIRYRYETQLLTAKGFTMLVYVDAYAIRDGAVYQDLWVQLAARVTWWGDCFPPQHPGDGWGIEAAWIGYVEQRLPR